MTDIGELKRRIESLEKEIEDYKERLMKYEDEEDKYKKNMEGYVLLIEAGQSVRIPKEFIKQGVQYYSSFDEEYRDIYRRLSDFEYEHRPRPMVG
ncbi:MAG: hypothetical protein JSV56_04485 [Methanomassiliicoccales archaeon]|nr:MAG: hypothetical protein JSV56_04485 [Methanomassiliicoccales archaeon]